MQRLSWLFILPMRNGNSFSKSLAHSGTLSFYPTYEEWKRFSVSFLSIRIDTFYPTYEEWKLHIAHTSEQWAGMLFILPMRNGNK